MNCGTKIGMGQIIAILAVISLCQEVKFVLSVVVAQSRQLLLEMQSPKWQQVYLVFSLVHLVCITSILDIQRAIIQLVCTIVGFLLSCFGIGVLVVFGISLEAN